MTSYDVLKIENQLCFPLYAASKEVVKAYKPLLQDLNLTYTQYLVMLILWQYGDTNVSDLGRRLFLDSGTLTPLLKKLEFKGYITRLRSDADERNLMIALTDDGISLKSLAVSIPHRLAKDISITLDDAKLLHGILYKILNRSTCHEE